MKKYGKYEKRPEGVPEKPPKVKNVLLQTYFTSLVCLVLCVTMFFGTSYAWFTSEVNNEGNEIYIGILDADLKMNGQSLNNSDTKVFEKTIHWEPGYTALRNLSVVNEGDLAFNYVLNFKDGKLSEEASGLDEVAQWFDVWVYSNDNHTAYSKDTDETFVQMTEKDGWTRVGTLAEVLAGRAVFSGSMTADDVNAVNESGEKVETTHTYTIALHMKDDAENSTVNGENSLMGQKISLNVKLTAYQMGSEEDSFGNSKYDTATFVSSAEELQAALDNATGETTIVLGDNITGDVTVTQKPDVKITIDGNGKTYYGSITVNGKSARYETAGLTIKNVHFDGVSGNDTVYINLGKSGDDSTRYTNYVTIKDCTFTSTGNQTAAVKSYTGGDKNLIIDGCTINAGMHSLAQLSNVEEGLKISNCKVNSKNGINLNYTTKVEVTNCEFDVTGYAVRFGVDDHTLNGSFLIKDCTLKSACNEGDAVIIFRGNMSGSNLTLENTTVIGNSQITNNSGATVNGLN